MNNQAMKAMNSQSNILGAECKQSAASRILEMVEEIGALSHDLYTLADNRLAPLRLDVPTAVRTEDPKQVAMPPYFDSMRSYLETIRANLYATRDAIVRCEI